LALGAAGRLATVFFPVADFLAGLAREDAAAFLALRAGAAAAFLLVCFFAFAVEADFFFVTFFRASFRLAVDLPALAVFFELVFFAAFLATFFLAAVLVVFFDAFLVVFLADFLVVACFRETAFFFAVACLLAGFFLARAAVAVREVFFAVFLLARFLAAVFLVGIQEILGWFQMQPAIIHS
jgi:hypothetical protein